VEYADDLNRMTGKPVKDQVRLILAVTVTRFGIVDVLPRVRVNRDEFNFFDQ
jgi:hypothetical protein